MFINDFDRSIEIIVQERYSQGTQAAGDTNFLIKVRFNDFGGSGSCWVEYLDLCRFVEELKRLDTAREGLANLHSQSPEELKIEIKVIDRSGHVAATGQFGQYIYEAVSGGTYLSVIRFFIPFCPSQLPEIISEFESLLTIPLSDTGL